MKISMHMISDRMSRHIMHTDITYGKLSFDRIRFCSHAEDATDSDTLYLLEAFQATESGYKNGVVCLNENDRIFIESDTPTLIFSEILEIFYFYDSIEKKAIEQINNACTLQELLETLSAGIAHNITIANAGCKLVALVHKHPFAPETAQYYADMIQNKHLRLPEVYKLLDNGLLDMRIAKAARYSTDFFPVSHILRDIFRFNDTVARITVIEDVEPCSVGECQFVDIVAETLRMWYEKTNNTSSDFSPGAFYRNLLMNEKNRYNKEDFLFYSTLLKWYDSNEKYVVCIDIAGKKEAEIKFALFHLCETLPQLQPFISEDFICLVINTDAKETAQLKANIVRELKYIGMHAGLSYPFHEITNISSAYDEAKIAAVYGSKAAGAITKCSNCKLEYIHSVLRKNLRIELSTGKLHLLKEYDMQHNTNYHKTLYIYLLNERNQNLTAEQLNIHRNTLTRRIEKIYTLICSELNSPLERLSLLFSFFSEEEKPLNHMQ